MVSELKVGEMSKQEGAGLPVDIAKTRDKLALVHYEIYDPLDKENENNFNWIPPRFSAFCYGFDAAYLAEQEKCERLREALARSYCGLEQALLYLDACGTTDAFMLVRRNDVLLSSKLARAALAETREEGERNGET